MPTIDNLDIQISTSLKNTDKQLDNLINKLGIVSSSLSSVGRTSATAMSKVSSSTTKAAKSTKSLASVIGKFYANYAYIIRGIKALNNSIKSTANYIEAFNYFEVSFNKIAGEWKQDYQKFGYSNAEEYAKSFTNRVKESLSKLSGVQINVDADGKGLLTETGMKNLGLNIQEITQYASQLASVTNSIGQTGEVSLRTSNAFTKLAGDISSLFNVDYSAVAKNLQSGLIGQSRALYKYGIDITNATLQTYAYKLGVEKAVSEMTQAEKMQLRMIAILDQSKVSWGDLANTINSPSNMLRQFKTNLKEAGMVLGQLFVPLLSKVLPVVNGVTIAIKRLLGNIAGILGIKLDLSSFGQGASDLGDSYEDISDSLDDVADSAKKAKAGLRAFDELKTINMPDSSSSASSGLGNTIDLTEEIIAATEEYERVWQEAYDKMNQKAQAFADTVEKALKPVEKLFQDIKIGDWFAVGQDVSNIVTGITDFFSRAIEKIDWEQVGTNIGLFLEGIDWLKVFESAVNLGKNIKDAIIEVVQASFEEAPLETFLVIASLILTKIGSAMTLVPLKVILKNIIVSGFNKITLDSWIKEHFSSSVAGLLPGSTANPLTLSGVVLSIYSFLLGPMGIGTPAFDVVTNEIFGKLSAAVDLELPKWVEDFWNDLGTGLAVGALGGSWIPGLGTVAGAIIGGIIGAMKGIKLENGTVLDVVMNAVFGADVVEGIFQEAKKAFEEKDWASFGINILKGIGTGIQNFLYFLNYPIHLLFETIANLICDIFGINSPAKNMEPYGKNIFLGIVEGFGGSFEEMRAKIEEFFTNLKQWWESNKPNLSSIETKIKVPKLTVEWDTTSFAAKALQKLGLKGFPDFSVQWYKTGGYLPSSFSLIGAGENGIPEMLGSVGGRPAIVGDVEITGIRDAIYSTGQQETNLMQTMVGLLRIIAEKEYGITDDQIGKSAQRYAKDYFNRTGNEAYSF